MEIIKALWIGAAVFVLSIALYAFDGKPNSDIEVLLGWYMLALAFPSGLLVPLAGVALYDGLSITVETSYLEIVLVWIGFFALGYLQWFKLLPYFVSMLCSRKNKLT